MMRKVLEDGAADEILAAGVTGLVMLIAKGIDVGETTRKFLEGRGLEEFIPEAKRLLDSWGSKYVLPVDLAYEDGGLARRARRTGVGQLSARRQLPGRRAKDHRALQGEHRHARARYS